MRASSPDSDYDDYLSSLKKKTVGNTSDFHIDGLSDLSDLSDKKDTKSKNASKFLKKSTKNDTKIVINVDNKQTKKSKKVNPSVKKDKTSKVNKTKKVQKPIKELSSSDSSISFGSLSLTPRPLNVSSSVSKLNFNEKTTKELHLNDEDDDSFGKDGRRFFKAKVIPSKETNVEKDFEDQITARDISSPRKPSLRTGLIVPSNKKVTIADPSSPISFKHITSPERSIISSSEYESEKDKDFCGQKIMSIDYFQDEELIEENISRSSDSRNDNTSFVGENIMSIADLVNDDVVSQSFVKPVSEKVTDDNSLTEIRTIPLVTPRKSLSFSQDRSLSEIATVPATGRSTARSSTSKQYSVDLEESVSKGKGSSINHSRKGTPSYSSDFTKDESSIKSESIQARVPKAAIKEKKHKHPKYNWDEKSSGQPYVPPSLGRGAVDPTPIAQYVVSPEALESVTAYSPCMILLTNMLRQQLQMTTDFIATQRRLYDSMISTIKPSYHYCTLEETKEFIRMNKSTSRKESRQLVDEEN